MPFRAFMRGTALQNYRSGDCCIECTLAIKKERMNQVHVESILSVHTVHCAVSDNTFM